MPTLSLDDVKPNVITIEVKNAVTGQVRAADIVPPTLAEWNNAQFGIVWPDVNEYKKQRMKDGKKEDYIDFNDADYLRKRELANEELNMRRVTQALLKAGNFPELNKLSLEDATKKLCEQADRDFLRGAFQALVSLVNGTTGGVEAKKAAFPDDSVSANGHVDLPEETEMAQ
jgi:hypothetical protein